MSIKIVVDSACDLPETLAVKYGIIVVPLYIIEGDKTYRDGIDLTREEFYRRLPGFFPAVTTAAPSPKVFKQVYERLAAEGATQILSIHISPSLSSLIESARLAAADTTEVEVTVLDSQQLSMGIGFLAITAAQAVAQGYSMESIVERLNNQIKRTHVFAALDTLEYLKRSGRMSRATSLLGNLLQIKPILRMYCGNPTSEKVRTRRRASEHLLTLLKSMGTLEKVALLHAAAPKRAEDLLQQAVSLLPDIEIIRSEISPVLGAHIGPGVIGFVCVTREA
jgi:DegV family protein with EDD domain